MLYESGSEERSPSSHTALENVLYRTPAGHSASHLRLYSIIDSGRPYHVSLENFSLSHPSNPCLALDLIHLPHAASRALYLISLYCRVSNRHAGISRASHPLMLATLPNLLPDQDITPHMPHMPHQRDRPLSGTHRRPHCSRLA